MSLSSLNSIDDDEIISNKKNKESEKMICAKISKNENFTQSKIELITQPSKTEINNIKKEDPNKNKELEDTEIKIEEKKIKEEEEKEEKETPLKNE